MAQELLYFHNEIYKKPESNTQPLIIFFQFKTGINECFIQLKKCSLLAFFKSINSPNSPFAFDTTLVGVWVGYPLVWVLSLCFLPSFLLLHFPEFVEMDLKEVPVMALQSELLRLSLSLCALLWMSF